MARIRTIKPEFWQHEDLSELPEATHMLAAALLNHADDEGYFNANPRLLQAQCFPLREPSVSVQESLIHLSNVGYIRLYEGSDGKSYGHIVAFLEHQKVNRPTPSKIKHLCLDNVVSLSTHAQLSERSLPERKGKERKGKELSRVRARETADDLDDEFEQWWEHAPRKVGKGGAKRSYRAARKKADAETLLAGIKRHAQEMRDKGTQARYIPHPATWLNHERWLDEASACAGEGDPHDELYRGLINYTPTKASKPKPAVGAGQDPYAEIYRGVINYG